MRIRDSKMIFIILDQILIIDVQIAFIKIWDPKFNSSLWEIFQGFLFLTISKK